MLENKRLSEGFLKKEKGEKKEGDAAKNATSPVWWGFLNEVRLYFEEKQNLG
jgi:hypothetical protein